MSSARIGATIHNCTQSRAWEYQELNAQSYNCAHVDFASACHVTGLNSALFDRPKTNCPL